MSAQKNIEELLSYILTQHHTQAEVTPYILQVADVLSNIPNSLVIEVLEVCMTIHYEEFRDQVMDSLPGERLGGMELLLASLIAGRITTFVLGRLLKHDIVLLPKDMTASS